MVTPRNADDVAAVVTLAAQANVPVLARERARASPAKRSGAP